MDLQFLARQAVLDAEPAIFGLMGSDVLKRKELFLVAGQRVQSTNGGYVGQPWAEWSAGDQSKWQRDYMHRAYRNFYLSVRTGLSGREVHGSHPELLQDEDCTEWGSVVLGSLVVACDGVQEHYNEAIAYVVVHLWRARIESVRITQRSNSTDYFDEPRRG